MITIKSLKNPVGITLEQYECELCHKKFYVNSEDNQEKLKCPFCNEDTKNTRIFDIEIKGVGTY